jgi:YVTN family beta-propeller protein
MRPVFIRPGENAMDLRISWSIATAAAALAGLSGSSQSLAFAYIANNISDTVSVIDTESNTVTATIPVGAAPLGVAVTPDGNSVYVTNISASTVSVIDTATNTVSATIPVGFSGAPKGVAVTPDGSKVYVGGPAPVNSKLPGFVSVIATNSNMVTATRANAEFW